MEKVRLYISIGRQDALELCITLQSLSHMNKANNDTILV